MLRFLALFLTQLVLWNLGTGLNHAVCPWHISLFTQGLFILYASLSLSPAEGLVAALLGGFLVDASQPVHFGREALLFAIVFTFMLRQRSRLPLEEPLVQSAIGIALNLVLYLAQLLIEWRRMSFVSEMWGRTLWEILLSSLLVGLIAPWFCAFQRHSLDLASRPWMKRRRVSSIRDHD